MVEGQRELFHCINAGYEVKTIFADYEKCGDDLKNIPTDGIEVVEVSSRVYEKIAYRGSTEGMVAVVKTRQHTLQDLEKRMGESPLYIILESVEKPGNMGAILRSADAAGVDKGERIAYYFKAFDTSPQLNLRYADGTIVTAANIYNYPSDQKLECFVEMRLRITRLDFRDYFEEVLGWDNADISTISLVTAWYDEFEENEHVYKYYQDIIPFSKFNFKAEDLRDLTRALDFTYQVFY